LAARRALDASPNDEVLARRAISRLIASGNRGGAMQAHDEFVRRSRSDLYVDPAQETSTRGETTSADRAGGAGTKSAPVVSPS
jgi:DNA-binding SARP family transcriptional activator